MKKSILLCLVALFYSSISYAGCCSKQNCKSKDKLQDQKSSVNENQKVNETKELIKEAYGKVVDQGGMCCLQGGCCGGGSDLSQEVGYSKEDLDALADANLGLGCGSPVSFDQIKAGDTVLDLGSGAGLDCFLAARKVGVFGKVIGVDMTQKMIDKARENAARYNITNVEFRLGDIEHLPVVDHSIDLIMSNCVINLAPNKRQVFQEAYRVLKADGTMTISDVVLLGELTVQQRQDAQLLCACVSGALLKNEYLALLEQIGFEVTIIDEDKNINQKWFGSDELPISSLKFIAKKR